jgi:hypothetical protein
MPSDVVATLFKYLCCEELMQIVHTGCKRLIKHLAATKVDLSVTPNHYGYLNISRLIHSLQRTFPSAKTVAFESSELVKLPVHLPANFDCQSSVIDHLVWPIESLTFHEKGPFAVAFATFMAINGLYRMNNIFPALMTLTVDTKMMFASTPDPIKDMLPFIPSSCIRIELDQHEQLNGNVAQYEIFKDRILSASNNRQMTSLCLRPLPLTQTELSLPQFQSLESLEIQCSESIDMGVLPRSLTSIVLDAAYSVDRRVWPPLEQVVFSNAPPNLIRFSSTLKLHIMDSTLPASLVHFRTHDVEDLNHAIHAPNCHVDYASLKSIVSSTTNRTYIITKETIQCRVNWQITCFTIFLLATIRGSAIGQHNFKFDCLAAIHKTISFQDCDTKRRHKLNTRAYKC